MYDFTQTSSPFLTVFVWFPSGDCTWSGGGRSVWCWSHGGAGEVPPVSSWMKGLDVWPPAGPLREPIGGHAGVLKPAALHRRRTLVSPWRQAEFTAVDSAANCHRHDSLYPAWRSSGKRIKGEFCFISTGAETMNLFSQAKQRKNLNNSAITAAFSRCCVIVNWTS